MKYLRLQLSEKRDKYVNKQVSQLVSKKRNVT